MFEFYEDQYLTEIKTIITGIFSENNQNCVRVEKNIFYPRGGGQKGDRGLLNINNIEYKVIDTLKDQYNEDGILLVTEELVPQECNGSLVNCKLDWEFRNRQMRLHTAAHLHFCLLEKIAGKKLPYPKISDIQDGFVLNRYENDEITLELVDKVNMLFRETVSLGAEVKTYPDIEKKGFRWWECLGYKIPCGGTHVKDVSEIGEVEISYSKKKGMPTINIKLK